MEQNNELVELLYTALRSPLGLILKTRDADQLRFTLNQQRKLLGDDKLHSLSFKKVSDLELWITKKDSAQALLEGSGLVEGS